MAEAPPQGPPRNGLVRSIVDYGGLAAFLAVYLFEIVVLKKPSQAGLLTATWGLVAGSAVALVIGLVFERRVALLPLFAGLAALVFGGLTLFFHDPRFIKIKPTVINLALGLAMLGGMALGKNPLKAMFSGALNLSPAGWRRLTLHYGIFFLAMAGLNEAVWRTQPDAIWVVFRFPGLQILSVLFALAHVPMMMKDMRAMEAAAELEP